MVYHDELLELVEKYDTYRDSEILVKSLCWSIE